MRSLVAIYFIQNNQSTCRLSAVRFSAVSFNTYTHIKLRYVRNFSSHFQANDVFLRSFYIYLVLMTRHSWFEVFNIISAAFVRHFDDGFNVSEWGNGIVPAVYTARSRIHIDLWTRWIGYGSISRCKHINWHKHVKFQRWFRTSISSFVYYIHF